MQKTKGSKLMNRGCDSAAPLTPDGRYLIVRGRLWRTTNPALSKEDRDALVKLLMDARRMKGAAMRAHDAPAQERARQSVDEVKRKLGERGDVWWTDGSPDYNRQLAKNTPYAAWYEKVDKSNT